MVFILHAAANALALLGGVSIFFVAAVVTLLFPLPAIALLVLTGVSVLVVNAVQKGH